jgi:hypothetical protein
MQTVQIYKLYSTENVDQYFMDITKHSLAYAKRSHIANVLINNNHSRELSIIIRDDNLATIETELITKININTSSIPDRAYGSHLITTIMIQYAMGHPGYVNSHVGDASHSNGHWTFD